ncbi:P-loop ATPase, Sll1717 family [Actinokineospora sp. UTMC 2448]|uniref:P-loop ATPase, Sll1717 family n=1 Tax=Actinokineospora sp. UTMC 2448 TaxID=2268449 RepID=UPI002164563D|nr:hypothetical protein [Actinokineospora sp. UTMC 2448]UVS78784.1 hypothetical protein Actkin_02520 [Actinokineospora sp. UTMC 2448]
MHRAHERLAARDELGRVLTPARPFGPIATEDVAGIGRSTVDQLFDRNNRIYSQAVSDLFPAYIIGRKGAGKTAFLISSDTDREVWRAAIDTEKVYHEMLNVLNAYRGDGLFVGQRAEIWTALFDHVAMFHAWRFFDGHDPEGKLNVLGTYLGQAADPAADASQVAERFLRQVRERVHERPGTGPTEILEGMGQDKARFADARAAMRDLLTDRGQPLVIVMDNLEELHLRLRELTPVLAGLFRAVGGIMARSPSDRPYGVQICLPSELFDQIHRIAAAADKDMQGGYLKIYWSARELLRLAGTRLHLFLRTRHPDEYDRLARAADRVDEPEPDIALLRAALPTNFRSGLGIPEDPVAYLLRHTQLLPRHLIHILNSVFSRHDRGSTPWQVTPAAILAGTRHAEHLLVTSILAAYQASYPLAGEALRRLTGRLDICFPACELHKVYNRQGIRKVSGMDFDEFLSMLFSLGVLGIRFGQTGRYNKAHFQYTFDYELGAQEEHDHLCVHPLFTRYLLERSLPQLRKAQAHATYPYGCDPQGEDYRTAFGYTVPPPRN